MRWLQFVILLNFSIIIFSLKLNHNNSNSEFKNALTIFLNKIIEKKFRVLDIIEVSETAKNRKLFDLQTEVLKNVPKTINRRLTHFRRMKTTPLMMRRAIIIYLESLKLLHEFEKIIEGGKFDFSGFYLVVLYNDCIENVQTIFDELWKKYIYNIYVICESQSGINLLTFAPFENSSNCNDTTAKVVNKFINGKFINSPIIVSKLRNFHGCSFKIATVTEADNLVKKIHKNGTIEYFGPGLDMLKGVAESLNFNFNLQVMELNSTRHVLNVTAMGPFEKLFNKSVDIMSGEWVLKPSRTKFFDTTNCHGSTSVVFIVPPGRKFTPLQKLLRPFHWIVWIFLLSTFLIGIFVIFLINYKFKQLRSFVFGRNVKNPVMNLIAAIFAQHQRKLPQRNFSRFILINFLILCLIMRSVYQGGLLKFLQSNQRSKGMTTLKEILESNYTIYAYPSHEDVVNASLPEYSNRIKLYMPKTAFLENELEESDEKVGLENLRNILFALKQNSSKNIYHCKEPFIKLSLVWYLQRNSFLIKPLNEKIDSFVSGGLIDYWKKKYYADEGKIEEKLQIFNLKQLSGIFQILIFGYLLAFLAFLGEIVWCFYDF